MTNVVSLKVEDVELADALNWTRLARTPYLVIPRLALSAMPEWWQARLEELLRIADEAGLETPSYHVFRGGDDKYTRAKMVNPETQFVKIVKGREDPWSNYKYGVIAEVCPGFDSAKAT